MSTKRLKLARGTTAQCDAYIGERGEIVADKERNEIRLYDGVKQGGYVIRKTIRYV
jgi:hypothetical protein